MTTIVSPTSIIISHHGFAMVVLNTTTQQHALHAAQPIAEGEVISFFNAKETLTRPNYLTIQIGMQQHITLMPEFLQYINHSCSPNVFFDTTLMQLICLKPIAIGDELRFFYPSTEWQMDQPFVCNCGANNCLQLIQGAAYLSNSAIAQHRFTHFIMQQLAANK
ncbi:SET domain-containing protein-lysine N-methyltransferase [Parasediminibacterium paludis]|uniref:SET domain-containing protein-lysine N-methyltransferase n=1 Tax=Parasediminibacterium paludis TaxID=908966 RepID=A0ABV8Q1L9_9BACT